MRLSFAGLQLQFADPLLIRCQGVAHEDSTVLDVNHVLVFSHSPEKSLRGQSEISYFGVVAHCHPTWLTDLYAILALPDKFILRVGNDLHDTLRLPGSLLRTLHRHISS